MRVDFAVAREIATREGIKAVIDGDVARSADGTCSSARLVSAQTGEELATFREDASDENDIIPAIGPAVEEAASQDGRVVAATCRTRTRWSKVTTPSLEALQKYVRPSGD